VTRGERGGPVRVYVGITKEGFRGAKGVGMKVPEEGTEPREGAGHESKKKRVIYTPPKRSGNVKAK